MSQHLSLLRRDDLVQTIWYSIASPPARRVLETLFEIFCKPASMCGPPVRWRVTKSSSRRSSKEP